MATGWPTCPTRWRPQAPSDRISARMTRSPKTISYGTRLETESFAERADGSVRIDASIYGSRTRQTAIQIGEGGTRVREIGAKARLQPAQLLDRTLHLFLSVEERSGWDEESARLRAIGLNDPDGRHNQDAPHNSVMRVFVLFTFDRR
jgi:hypothetical protein